MIDSINTNVGNLMSLLIFFPVCHDRYKSEKYNILRELHIQPEEGSLIFVKGFIVSDSLQIRA